MCVYTCIHLCVYTRALDARHLGTLYPYSVGSNALGSNRSHISLAKTVSCTSRTYDLSPCLSTTSRHVAPLSRPYLLSLSTANTKGPSTPMLGYLPKTVITIPSTETLDASWILRSAPLLRPINPPVLAYLLSQPSIQVGVRGELFSSISAGFGRYDCACVLVSG